MESTKNSLIDLQNTTTNNEVDLSIHTYVHDIGGLNKIIDLKIEMAVSVCYQLYPNFLKSEKNKVMHLNCFTLSDFQLSGDHIIFGALEECQYYIWKKTMLRPKRKL